MLYNIEQCATDLARADVMAEFEKPMNRHYRIFDKRANVIHFAINKRNAMQALAEALSDRTAGDEPHGIDLRFYAGSAWRRVVPYHDADELTAEEVTTEEAEQIDKTLDFLLTFSRENSLRFPYMVEYGNGYTEETAAAYNFFAYIHHEKKAPDGMPNFVQRWAMELFGVYDKIEADDFKREQERLERRRIFYEGFGIVFDGTLNFRVDMGLDNEKPCGINEQSAIKFVRRLGGYNGFTPEKFEKIIAYCNEYFIGDYPKGNCNRGKKDYTILFGREGSIVLYLSARFKSEDEVKATVDELWELVHPDETTIEETVQGFGGKVRATIRLWWD